MGVRRGKKFQAPYTADDFYGRKLVVDEVPLGVRDPSVRSRRSKHMSVMLGAGLVAVVAAGATGAAVFKRLTSDQEAVISVPKQGETPSTQPACPEGGCLIVSSSAKFPSAGDVNRRLQVASFVMHPQHTGIKDRISAGDATQRVQDVGIQVTVAYDLESFKLVFPSFLQDGESEQDLVAKLGRVGVGDYLAKTVERADLGNQGTCAKDMSKIIAAAKAHSAEFPVAARDLLAKGVDGYAQEPNDPADEDNSSPTAENRIFVYAIDPATQQPKALRCPE